MPERRARRGVGEWRARRPLLSASRCQRPRAAAGGGLAPAGGADGGQTPDQAALAVLQARLEGAHTAARLHAQRRHEERERYEAERAELKSDLEFLRERMVRAEDAEREMRLLM